MKEKDEKEKSLEHKPRMEPYKRSSKYKYYLYTDEDDLLEEEEDERE